MSPIQMHNSNAMRLYLADQINICGKTLQACKNYPFLTCYRYIQEVMSCRFYEHLQHSLSDSGQTVL
ncbi:hypothetical protein AB205_0112950 [Aquarana catesbeiana]|uniref:Uncharacterized protein n=1 Tax=Aquarana catesbeiana TaxID=8400 RepID=A0A2G9SGM1_AQUCT|nr:hypothetical protein AB205_0112950 [Aquarana catesbeiana]